MPDKACFDKAAEQIGSAENILVTTHRKPDGDACGSVSALAEVLKAQGKEVTPLMLSTVPQWYEFVFAEQPAVLGEDISIEQLQQRSFDLVIIADTNSYSQLKGTEKYLRRHRDSVVVFDHHVTADHVGGLEIVDVESAATASIVFDFLKYNNWPINYKIAQGLFVGLATDTGWFHFTNTTARVHREVAELIEAGVYPPDMHAKLFRNFTLKRFRLMTRMQQSLELHFDGRFAVQYLMKKDFEQTGTDYTDTEEFIDQCQRISSVESAALFVELPDGSFKCSLRSSGAVNVRQIAQRFGGGGHEMAAGVKLDGPLEQAKAKIFPLLGEQLNASGGSTEGPEENASKNK